MPPLQLTESMIVCTGDRNIVRKAESRRAKAAAANAAVKRLRADPLRRAQA